MTLPEDYLEYPRRRHGMDHDLYPWSSMFARPKIAWPGGAKVALWITVSLEYFPLTPNDGPFRAPGHMVTPYPDYRTYTTRDYGNRVGIFRIFRVLDRLGLKASAPMNTAVAERYPTLAQEVTGRGWEVVAHGIDMNHIHYGGMEEAAERAQIEDAISRLRLRSATGATVRGWLSPARSQSANTPQLLADCGLDYVCDWVNDDLPYAITAPAGELVSMPFAGDLEDRKLLIELGHPEDTYADELLDAFKLFHAEAERFGGRILHLPLTPYVIGQPFRIQALESALGRILEHDGVWSATGAEIIDAWRAQAG